MIQKETSGSESPFVINTFMIAVKINTTIMGFIPFKMTREEILLTDIIA
jgi:hypothetical protein